MKTPLLCGIISIAASQMAMAFNLESHAFFTKTAFDKSVINGVSPASIELYQRLGFDRLPLERPFDQPEGQECTRTTSSGQFGGKDHYIDAQGTWLGDQGGAGMLTRCPTLYEQRSMPPDFSGLLPNPSAAVGRTGQLRFEGWLMRGVIREDDFKFGKYDNPNLTPDQDPWNDGYRSLGHFYNPVTNTTGIAVGTRAPAWALGVADTASWDSTQVPDPARGNHFSYMDARRFYWLALTYKEAPVSGGQPFSALLTRRYSNFRQNLWASTLKSIGHVVHLLQDSASPQHVRAEAHSFLCNGNLLEEGLGNQEVATRTFENFANYRVTFPFDVQLAAAGVNAKYSFANLCDDEKWRDMFEEAGQRTPAAVAAWTTSSYPIPQFSVQRKFFSTRAEDAFNSRRGLVDYTNRGFFTEGGFSLGFSSPPALLNDPSFEQGDVQTVNVPGLDGNANATIKLKALYWQVPDAVASGFNDPNLRNGKAPIASFEVWQYLGGQNAVPDRGQLSLANYVQIQDMLAPRAIAYTTGLINFFFRGKLEIEPITQRIFAVINQGEPHTINADGYPIRTSDGKVFGFTKIRLKVRNITDPIIESGTGANVPQRVGVGKLVAVARYHRNACYKADLTGERQLRYSPPPTLLVDEPTCPANLPTRTNYQEISVSAPQDILSDADLPGGTGVTPASLEKVFDFSMDPIPVNATDLFIQVVYRGQLGEETDGIAVGNYDLREPTFYAAWNNTDYVYNEVSLLWQNAGGAFPARHMLGIRVCAGNPSKWVYQYDTDAPQPGLPLPFTGQPPLPPGVLRLAFLFGKPAMPGQFIPYRNFPLMTAPSAQLRTGLTAGQIRQASREIYEETGVNALPMPSNCGLNPPAEGANVWCFDPVLKRRGLAMGAMSHPLYYSTTVIATNGPDVDAPPAQIPFVAQTIRTGGVVRFDDETPLADCPAGPALLTPEQQRLIELREEAWELGIDLDAVVK